MKNIIPVLFICTLIGIISCSKDSAKSEKFKLLTTPTWQSDSLLVNGLDASEAGGLLEDFKGAVKFNADYSGTFGKYVGTWRFAFNETEVVIASDSLALPITAVIDELTQTDLKIKTSYQIPGTGSINIRMTFKAQ
jgi:hypothetical protein